MQAEGTIFMFARREKSYMMRSERRSSYNRSPRGRRPKGPRRRRGYFYGVFALIVSIIVWPVGMLLLWTRKLRWGGGVKLLASLLTLVLCVCWIGWALTVQTDDWRITSTQDKVNAFLADSADVVATKVSGVAHNISAASVDAYAYARGKLSDGILAGVSLAGEAKDWVAEAFAGGSTAAPEGTPLAPSVLPAASPEVTPTPTPKLAPTGFLPNTTTAAPTETATAEPTVSAAAKPTVTATSAPTPTATAQPTATAVQTATATPTATAKPTAAATPTAAPTPVATEAASLQNVTASAAQTMAATATPSAKPTSEPTVGPTEARTLAPTVEPTGGPTPAPTAVPTAEPTAVPTAAPTVTPTVEPTAAPTAEPTAAPSKLDTPAPAQPSAEPTLLDIPLEPSPAPTLKPAGLAIVYHTSNGVGYHVRSTCVGMSGAKPYTFAESVAAGYHSCGNCNPPDESLLTTDEPVVWVDADNVYHTSDECAAFVGQYKLMTLKDAYESGATPCGECGATSYIYQPETVQPTVAPTAGPTPAPTEAPTAEPTEAPTAEPTSASAAASTIEPTPAANVEPTAGTDWMDDVLLPTLKPAGEAIVYHTSNGKAYHVAATCVGMSGAKPYTLAACVADGYRACGYCNPPAEDLIGQDCAWVDEAGVCHVSDECESFDGQYRLVPLTEAVSEGLALCPDCGMDKLAATYLEKKAAEDAALMELAKSVTVYYNDNSKYYHTADSCVNMPSADAHTLYDALEKGLKRCKRCNPPTLDDLRDQLENGTEN